MPTSLDISRRVKSLKPSVTVAFMNRAKTMQRQGLDVLSFAAGEPDFDTPDVIKDAAIAALRAGQTKYMPTLGDPESRAAIAEKFTRENAIPHCTADHVAIGAGGKHQLFVALHCLLDEPRPGDAPQDVLLPVPAWVSYAPIAELAGGRVVEIPTTPATDFLASPEQIKAAITPNARVLILNSPSNPCGTMYPPDHLRAIARVVADAARTIAPNLVVLSDEIYEKIAYAGVPHFSIGSVPDIAERTVTLNGLSKAYAMTGWRIGYTGTSGDFGKRLIQAMATLQGQISTNNTSFTYPAIPVALRRCEADAARMRDAFAARAALINRRLSALPGIRTTPATGAFYAFPDVSAHFGKASKAGRPIRCAMDMAEALLEESLLAFVPGEDFGGCGKNHLRISFACSEQQIEQGMNRFAEFLGALRSG
ncbi:MAG: pyridoxal phosphate-dependent aminotransferase [Planctomycetota bacterium]|nr:pyridoxal phosphate-dependent aminotransferase [Planctomycetota bacterium]